MQLIIPMAGLGQRFIDAGYTTPKPLIPVSGLPMVVRVVHDLPPAERVVFLVHPEHNRRYDLETALREHFPTCAVLETPGLTAGQACTVRLAEPTVDLDDDVLVAACDATHVYDAEQFDTLRDDATTDCLVWTYHGEPRVLTKPTAYGWVRCERGSDEVLEVSCKKPLAPCTHHAPRDETLHAEREGYITENLLGDPVISGFFWFRTAKLLFAGIDELVERNWRVNNEFYLDVVPNVLIERGARVRNFPVEKYIGWGTPHDLEDYRRWERYFTTAKALVAG